MQSKIIFKPVQHRASSPAHSGYADWWLALLIKFVVMLFYTLFLACLFIYAVHKLKTRYMKSFVSLLLEYFCS